MTTRQPLNALARFALLACCCLIAVPASAEKYDAAVPEPTFKEIAYGPHERNVLDFWKAKAASDANPAPLAFIIHGGGWRGGSKERAQRFADVGALLKEGISVVAINYRLIPRTLPAQDKIDTTKNPPVHAPLRDAALALQFVRSKANDWHIDKTRIGAAGGSAGACSSLWLAFHDDLADPDSKDPVLRESSRLACAAVIGAQTTLDPAQMKEWTPNSKYGGHAFGLPNFQSFLDRRDEILPWIDQYSPYANVSKGDPPIYLIYRAKPEIGKPQKDPTHTSNFGLKLQEHCKANGVACELYYPGAKGAKHQSPTAFLIATLKAK